MRWPLSARGLGMATIQALGNRPGAEPVPGGEMRDRDKILGNLEALYRDGFGRAEAAGEEEAMVELDFAFQRDQLIMEALLDVRDLLAALDAGKTEEGKTTSLLEKAQALRRITKLR